MNAHYKQTIDFTDELASLIDPAEYFPHPPSSYHFGPSSAPHPRHTPSPQQQHQQQPPYQHQQQRSRSRSRPPSSNESCPATSAGSIGPARRSRRNNSVSSTSPPPPYARPHAIVIPATRTGNANGWFSQSSASEFSLPTPSSEMGYSPFSLADQQQKVDFSLSSGYQQMHSQNSPTSYHHHPYPPSSSVPVSLAIAAAAGPPHHPAHPSQHQNGPPPPPSNPHHHHHHHPNGPGSLAGALSSSLPITHPSSNPLGPSALSGAFAISPGGIPVPPGLASNFSVTVGLNAPSNSPTSPTSAAGPLPGPPTTTTALQTAAAALSPQDKQALIANEKRRRRRESHNAVERRRRDNINEKISELATLIPECMLEGGTTNPAQHNGSVSPTSEGQHFVDGSDPLLPAAVSLSVAMKKEDGVKEEGDPAHGAGASVDAGIVKANKGMILRKSVEYIRYLQQLVTAQGARNRELEQELKAYRSGSSALSANSPSSSSPATSLSSGPSAPRGATLDSSSIVTLHASNGMSMAMMSSTAIDPLDMKRKRPSSSSRRKNGITVGEVRTPPTSDTSGEEGDNRHRHHRRHNRDDEHEHDECSDLEGDFEDDGHNNNNPVGGGGMGYAGDMGMGMGMVLAEEDEEQLRLDFVNSVAAATANTNPGLRGRRAARGREPIPSTTMVNHQLPMGLQNLDVSMMPDGMEMDVEVDEGGAASNSRLMNGSEESLRGRTSTRASSSNGIIGQKPPRGGGGVNGMGNGVGVGAMHLKEEVVEGMGGHGHVGMVHGHGVGPIGHGHAGVGMGLGMQS